MATMTSRSSTVTALDVAKYLLILGNAEEQPEFISNLRLQKLLYYVQGWSLVSRGREMFSEDFEAWTHGPVVRSVYREYADHKFGAIPTPTDTPVLSEDDEEFIREVWDAYKGFSAIALRDMTHNEDPWKSAYQGPNVGQAPGAISKDSIRDYFEAQAASE
jgi:uncharacterized phage-associated protein